MTEVQKKWTVEQCLKLAEHMNDLQGQNGTEEFWKNAIGEIDRIHELAKRERAVAKALVQTLEFMESLEKAVNWEEVKA